MVMMLFLLVYLVLVNGATYALYWHDKRTAIARTRRVPEAMLLWAGFLGGTPAALLAQHRLRHKLKKGRFQYRFWTLTAVQFGILVFLPAPLLYMF